MLCSLMFYTSPIHGLCAFSPYDRPKIVSLKSLFYSIGRGFVMNILVRPQNHRSGDLWWGITILRNKWIKYFLRVVWRGVGRGWNVFILLSIMMVFLSLRCLSIFWIISGESSPLLMLSDWMIFDILREYIRLSKCRPFFFDF